MTETVGMHTSLYDLSPALQLMLLGLLISLLPIAWLLLRTRGQTASQRWKALAWVTLFLTFDLVLFGAFTRLTDSGLGCPDWPGCYGSATPLGARDEIHAAQTALPTGPVTHGKAWIEMVHRYFATGVGALITLLMVSAWWMHRARPQSVISPWWPTVTWLAVCIQGAFGALTVTMKLFPAIVTLHLLGGYTLLALLTVLSVHQSCLVQPQVAAVLPRGLLPLLVLALLMLVIQATSGAWVSTQYAVLVCGEFPKCQGSWWPNMDFKQALDWWHPLGVDSTGNPMRFEALTAIHVLHRLLALFTFSLLGGVAWYVYRCAPVLRRFAIALLGLLLLQFITGLSNVVLGWPLLAAVMHTGGAGAMVVVLVWMVTLTQLRSTHSHAVKAGQ
jgi:cytochrome c oxidase assembly protein subunit 15